MNPQGSWDLVARLRNTVVYGSCIATTIKKAHLNEGTSMLTY